LMMSVTSETKTAGRCCDCICACDALLRSASGVEGHDSCFQVFSNSAGGFWQTEADCVSRGGHLLTTRQSTKRQGGLLDAVYAVFPGKDMHLGGYRLVVHLQPYVNL
jgi:hypothetical protein